MENTKVKYRMIPCFDDGMIKNDEKRLCINAARLMGRMEALYNQDNDATVKVKEIMDCLEEMLAD